MAYLIDGYNLIGFCDSISLGATHKELALSRLLSSLSDLDMHLVFDGKNANYPYGSREKIMSHTLIFTPPDESADDFIKQGCSKSKYKQWIVVTNDRDILFTCKKTRRLSLSCDAFLRRLVQNRPHTSHTKPLPSSANIAYWLKQFGG
jgi:predicted RNA-binding protein with PIN domain